MAFEALTAANIGDGFTAATYEIIRNNFDFLRTMPQGIYQYSSGAGNLTTTSTSFGYITGFEETITTEGNPILIMFNARLNGTTVRIDFEVDGAQLSADTDGLGAPGATGESSICRVVSVAAGSHTVKVMWKVTSGTGTLYAAGFAQLYVRELN
jgi:hypothetical protein